MARKGSVRSRATAGSYQARWLVAYWVTVALTVVFLLLAITGEGVAGVARIAITLGVVAALAGTLMAVAVSRMGVSDVEFDEATSAMRVITVAWVVLVTVLVVGTVLGTGAGDRRVADAGTTASVVGVSEGATGALFGLAALFVVVGDGYTRYRVLTRDVRRAQRPQPPGSPG
ncbi:hypothetical protein GCM10022415_18340 [Knoellia locipacati]|uniref:Uncharacterized protein n=1 Tax=Knoellia locipacati TaxID=882824 RepID=A0A512T0N1_9MICO|nr:hypothetical protein [Knoellia locipacati]GEQ13782.1 hypothetical protein KLO01_18290 [Knoellia locipacati]